MESQPTASPSSSRPIRWPHYWQYAIFWCLQQLLFRLSPPQLRKMEQFLAFVFGRLFQVRQAVLRKNLAIAFPALDATQRQRLIEANYLWFARMTVEVLRMECYRGQTAQVARLHDLDVIAEAFAEKRGVIVVSGHFGYWELIVPALAEQGYPTYIYVGEQTNLLADRAQNRARAMSGTQTISKGPASSYAFLRALKAGGILAMLVDQNDRKSDLFVDFFGKKAAMPPGVGRLHLVRRSPVIFSYCTFGTDGKCDMHFERIHYEASGHKETDLLRVSQAVMKALETAISQVPEQYFWMHKRWRTRPPEDPTPVY